MNEQHEASEFPQPGPPSPTGVNPEPEHASAATATTASGTVQVSGSTPSGSTPSAKALPPSPTPSPQAFAPTDKTELKTFSLYKQRVENLKNTARQFGRADDEGNVFLHDDGKEMSVGQYPGAGQETALRYFVQKFDEIVARMLLIIQRMEAQASASDLLKTCKSVREQLVQRHGVGDFQGAETLLDTIESETHKLQHQEQRKKEELRKASQARREHMVHEVESLAAQEQIHWKTTNGRVNELLEQWRIELKSGVRLDRSIEDALWKRLRTARNTLDQRRRTYFAQLDSVNAESKARKEALVQEAEALAQSTDWGRGTAEYRNLMERWRSAPRGNKKDDDVLWKRFRGAQDTFFAARQAANELIDRQYAENLAVKEALLLEAQKLLPITDPQAAKKQLHDIRRRWEEAGKVPRADISRMENGFLQVEERLREAEREHWKRTNPETRARANSALSQLEASIASLETELLLAQQRGDAAAVTTAQEALDARRTWLEQIHKSTVHDD